MWPGRREQDKKLKISLKLNQFPFWTVCPSASFAHFLDGQVDRLLFNSDMKPKESRTVRTWLGHTSNRGRFRFFNTAPSQLPCCPSPPQQDQILAAWCDGKGRALGSNPSSVIPQVRQITSLSLSSLLWQRKRYGHASHGVWHTGWRRTIMTYLLKQDLLSHGSLSVTKRIAGFSKKET